MSSFMTYTERAATCRINMPKSLFLLLDKKQTNLALSADVTRADELIALATLLGPHICILKTHIDIISDFTPALTQTLSDLAKKHDFLIFEDRKFADIGNTVKHQYEDGIYRIADWAHLTNAHVLPGPGIIEGLKEVGLKKQRGLILLAEMSSSGHLMDADYIKATLQMAEDHPDFVIGFVTQQAVSKDPHWINFTPGVKLEGGTDQLKQQYQTPETAILDHKSDVIIVGRGITHAKDPLARALAYKEAGWQAYLRRCKI